MQIVTRGKRAQAEVECLSSAVCVFGRLRAKACGGADLGLETPSGAASEAQGCRAPTSSHGLQSWWCLRRSIGTAWPRRVLIPLLLAHLLLSAYAPLREAEQRGGNHVFAHVEPRIENP